MKCPNCKTEIGENDIGMDALDLMMYDMRERD